MDMDIGQDGTGQSASISGIFHVPDILWILYINHMTIF